MKFDCLCGRLIPDQTDALPHKARFVGDQDWSGLMETIDDRTASQISATLWQLSRIAYQCGKCGRIWLNDKAGKLHSFAPDHTEAPRNLFTK